MFEQIIVMLLVAAVIFITIRKLYLVLSGKDSCCACGQSAGGSCKNGDDGCCSSRKQSFARLDHGKFK